MAKKLPQKSGNFSVSTFPQFHKSAREKRFYHNIQLKNTILAIKINYQWVSKIVIINRNFKQYGAKSHHLEKVLMKKGQINYLKNPDNLARPFVSSILPKMKKNL